MATPTEFAKQLHEKLLKHWQAAIDRAFDEVPGRASVVLDLAPGDVAWVSYNLVPILNDSSMRMSAVIAVKRGTSHDDATKPPTQQLYVKLV